MPESRPDLPSDRERDPVPFIIRRPVGIIGTSGVWTNVSPAGLDLAGTSNGGDNYGAQEVIADPLVPGVCYCWTCYNGVWKSTDYGTTWTKLTNGSQPIDGGKAWCAAIAPSGAYMLSAAGYNVSGTPNIRTQCLKSTDGGVTWVAGGVNLGGDPYSYDVSPTDSTHAIVGFHDITHLSESTDSGATWTDKGAITDGTNTIDISAYVHFIDDTHILAVSQQSAGGTTGGSYLGTKSAGAWTWVRVSTQEHYHGSHQFFYDRTNNLMFSAGANGVEKSTDGGSTWSNVSTTPISNNLIATPSTLYACYSFPLNTASISPHIQSAARPSGSSWSGDNNPTGMTNGWMQGAAMTDGTRWCLVTANWNAGIWRYIE